MLLIKQESLSGIMKLWDFSGRSLLKLRAP